MKTPTIKDIAELAGVSKGTVDRVIHKRGKVSTKALEKVNAVLDEINYKPNLLARSLKNIKEYHICVVLPDFNEDPFWLPCNEGINEAINEFTSFGVFIEPLFFNPTDIKSFIDINNKVLEIAPDAVLLAPLFYKETLKIVANYVAKNIIVSKFNNRLEIESTKNFVGQDLFKSGRIAASLLKMLVSKSSTIAIIHIDEDFNNAIHMQEKEKGFKDYFSNTNESDYKIETYSLTKDNLSSKLNSLFENSLNVSGIFVTTSKVYKIAEYIKNNSIKNVKVIGYDLLEKNIDYMNDDIINFLIHQNPKKQVYLGISYLVDYFLFKKDIPKKSLLPIDIITSENLETYSTEVL